MSVAQSALKIDTLTITVLEPASEVPPSFSHDFESQVVSAGVGATWAMPDIVTEGDLSLVEVTVVPEDILSPFISYDGRQIIFSDDPSSASLVGKFLKIQVRLTDSKQRENLYVLIVKVIASEDLQVENSE